MSYQYNSMEKKKNEQRKTRKGEKRIGQPLKPLGLTLFYCMNNYPIVDLPKKKNIQKHTKHIFRYRNM